MQQTALRSPLMGLVMRGVARGILRLYGWKAVGEKPDFPKYVMTAAPHTSNWDFFFAIAVLYALDVDIYWMGKKEMFPWPVARFFKWLGGIPVDRDHGHQAAKDVMRAFKEHDRIVVLIPPEGTRSRVDEWKKGFYLIAKLARTPIVCGYLDYKTRQGGIGPTIQLTGNYEADTAQMRAFYHTIQGKYPQNSTLNDHLVEREDEARPQPAE